MPQGEGAEARIVPPPPVLTAKVESSRASVRLPHVESTLHGQVAGAPLGRHTPLNPLGLDPFNPFVFISGTFTRFSNDELLDRYRSRDQYARRVRRAADHLAASGYITNPDRMALIAAAECEPLQEELQCPK